MRLERLSCRRRVALLCDYLDRELPASERAVVEAHRRSCKPCAALLRGLERTVAALKALKKQKASAKARAAWRSALRR